MPMTSVAVCWYELLPERKSCLQLTKKNTWSSESKSCFFAAPCDHLLVHIELSLLDDWEALTASHSGMLLVFLGSHFSPEPWLHPEGPPHSPSPRSCCVVRVKPPQDQKLLLCYYLQPLTGEASGIIILAKWLIFCLTKDLCSGRGDCGKGRMRESFPEHLSWGWWWGLSLAWSEWLACDQAAPWSLISNHAAGTWLCYWKPPALITMQTLKERAINL